ncbi:hypothetical protein GGU11DRAFT_683178, partial [Lentinula aff. detonsa]
MRSTGSTGPSSKLISPLVSRSTAPPVNPPTNRHERTISDSDCHSLVDEPIRIAPPKNHTSSAQAQVPTASELETLLTLPLLDEHGQKIEFGDILNAPAKDSDKTVIVLFIRHFWCPLDQDYVQEVVDILRRLSEDDDGWQLATKVVIISNGSSALIAKYKEIFDLAGKKGSNLKVKLYTDPTCRTYRILGMENVGEACISSPYKSYVKHTSTIGGIASVVLRAIKVGMPVWEKGGAIKQLGGELDTGIQVACAFAHRMSDTQDHTPFGDVL